jgi:ribonuclease P protein component
MLSYKKFTLEYCERLHKQSDFNRCFNKGKHLKNDKIRIVVYQRDDNNDIRRLGLITSRKIGIAVARNRTKRLIREFFRLNKYELKEQLDIIIILEKKTLLLNYNNLKYTILNLLKKGGYY